MRDEWADLNRRWWDERVPLHAAGELYGLEDFVTDPQATTLRPFEVSEVGDVEGRTLLHPQCHFGMDSLSWARRGAAVTGLDFSPAAVAAATEVAARAGLDAEFLTGNVFDAVEIVGGRTFDVVYTGLGALNWLPDIGRWAQVMAALTAPDGRFYLAEFHPAAAMLGDDDLTVRYPYFHDRDQPHEWDEAGSYGDPDAATEHNSTVEWTHGIGSVVTALIDAGLTIEFLHELDYTLYPRWPFLTRSGRDTYRLPEDMPSVPLIYSLRAHHRA
jgi:SAM-dependent methyltransferase